MTPKSKENVGILVKSIIEKDESMIHVKDSALVPYYIHNSKYMVEVEFTDKASLKYYTHKGEQYTDDFNGLKNKQLELAREVDANYIFVSNFYHENTLLGVITPFMIISEKETDFLLKNFYKNVPEKVSEAAEELEIVLYNKFYSYYTQGKTDMFGEILHVNNAAWNNYLPFLNFVFTLPYEDQNIESNKKILRAFSSIYDFIGIMTKEYSEGSHFCEYFDILSNDLQEEVVKSLKNDSCKKKPVYDSFLWSKGFKDINLDYLVFYREDADIFIDYFKSRSVEEKKVILEDIMEGDFINDKVTEWLNQNEAELLREVSFNG